MNPFSLENKTVLVTGASSGIGRTVAIECSKMGATVVLTARNEERLQQTLSQLEGDGHAIIVADLTDKNDRLRLVEQSPKLDGLVHCAGIVKTLMFQFIDAESLSEVMNVNFASPTLLSALLVENKKIAKNSSIVFISSVSGVVWGGR